MLMAVLVVVFTIVTAVCHAEVFAPPAALEGIHRTVVITLGTGLRLIVSCFFIHIKSLLQYFLLGTL